MPIKGLSEKRRLPRMGKIRLGVKVPNKKGDGEHPEETDYFVCPPIVRLVYGDRPKELIIIIPTEEKEIFFPQYLERWGNNVLLCKGDGEHAHCWDFDHGGLKEIDCPCSCLKDKKCKPSATLKFLLPEVPESAGIYEIKTGDRASIEDINSGIDYIREITKGKISWIPIKLIRAPMVRHRVEDKKLTVSTHYPIKFSLEGVSLQTLAQYARLDHRELLLPAADAQDPQEAPLLPAGILNEADQDAGKPAAALPAPAPLGDAPDVSPAQEGEPDEEQVDQGFEEAEIETLRRDLGLKMAQYIEAGGEIGDVMKMKAESLETPDQFRTQIKFYEQQIRQIKSRGESGQGKMFDE